MSPADPHPMSTFAQALDAAVRASGLSVATIRRRLVMLGSPISESALRSWRSGERCPEHPRSLDAVENLEQVLGLPDTSLVRHLGPSRRLRRSDTATPDELLGIPGALDPLLEAIDCLGLDEMESVGGTAVIDIGADRRVRAASNRMLWRARSDGAHRAHVVIAKDVATDRPPAVRLVGASFGRSAFDPDTGLAAWEIVWPRRLAVGETVMLEWICDDPADDDEATQVDGFAERRLDEVGVWVRFDGDTPRHVEWFEDSDKGSITRVAPLVGRSVEHHARDFGPGMLGFRWEW